MTSPTDSLIGKIEKLRDSNIGDLSQRGLERYKAIEEVIDIIRQHAAAPSADVVETLLIYTFLQGYRLGRVRKKPLTRDKLTEKAVWIKDMMLHVGAYITKIDEAIRCPKGRIAAPPMLITSLDEILDEIDQDERVAIAALGDARKGAVHTPGTDSADSSVPTPSPASREEAERRVLEVRGNWDAPGFDACVDAEMRSSEIRDNAAVLKFPKSFCWETNGQLAELLKQAEEQLPNLEENSVGYYYYWMLKELKKATEPVLVSLNECIVEFENGVGTRDGVAKLLEALGVKYVD